MKIKPLGSSNQPGNVSRRTTSEDDTHFNQPNGVSVFATLSKGEMCLVSDSGIVFFFSHYWQVKWHPCKAKSVLLLRYTLEWFGIWTICQDVEDTLVAANSAL